MKRLRLFVAAVAIAAVAILPATASARVTGPDDNGCFHLRGRTICVQL